MSKAEDALRARGIYNDWEFFKKDGVRQPFMYWSSGQTGLAGIGNPPGWRIEWPTGEQSRIPHSRKSEPEGAREFITKKWGITEFARCPFGGWGDAQFVKTRLKELLALPIDRK